MQLSLSRPVSSGLGFWDVFDGLADTVSSGWDSLTSGVSDWFGGADSLSGDDSFWDFGGTDWGVAWEMPSLDLPSDSLGADLTQSVWNAPATGAGDVWDVGASASGGWFDSIDWGGIADLIGKGANLYLQYEQMQTQQELAKSGALPRAPSYSVQHGSMAPTAASSQYRTIPSYPGQQPVGRNAQGQPVYTATAGAMMRPGAATGNNALLPLLLGGALLFLTLK